MIDKLLKTDILPEIDMEQLAARLHIVPGTPTYAKAAELAGEARELLHPAYLIRRFPIGGFTRRGFFAGGLEFQSRIVASKLEGQKDVWVYIATAGKEIDEHMAKTENNLDKYILDQIAYFGCKQAIDALSLDISTALGISRHIKLCPGSIIDWSVADVKKLFCLLEGDYQHLGLRVLESGLIDPLKSVSGMIVPTDEEFESCDICDKPNCPNRVSPFDEAKYEQMINL